MSTTKLTNLVPRSPVWFNRGEPSKRKDEEMTDAEAREVGLQETVILPTGWTVEWTDNDPGDLEVGPDPDVSWQLFKDGVLVADGGIGSDDAGLYEWLTGGDTYEPPNRRVCYDQEDSIQVIDYLRSVGALI